MQTAVHVKSEISNYRAKYKVKGRDWNLCQILPEVSSTQTIKSEGTRRLVVEF